MLLIWLLPETSLPWETPPGTSSPDNTALRITHKPLPPKLKVAILRGDIGDAFMKTIIAVRLFKQRTQCQNRFFQCSTVYIVYSV